MAIVEQTSTLTAQTVQTRPGLTSILHEWVTTVDHKKIGIMYVLMAVFFLVVAGCEALLIRIQLWVPRGSVLSPDRFNQLFTMHGTTMVFFMGMPILIGIANYVVPLQIGARDMAFPRLNAMGFWVTLLGGPDRLLQLPGPGRSAADWLVCLRPADRQGLHPFVRDRLLDRRLAGQRSRHHRGRGQLHRHHCLHALPGHGTAQGPLLYLDHPVDRSADRHCHTAVDRRPVCCC